MRHPKDVLRAIAWSPGRDRLDRCMIAYFVLLLLLLVWAMFNAPWQEGRALREDDEAMHAWFCVGKNFDAGPCVEWRLLEEDPQERLRQEQVPRPFLV